MRANDNRLDAPKKPARISPRQGAFLALPDTPNALRRQMLAAIGLAGSGFATAWPRMATATATASAVSAPFPSTFAESHRLAATLVKQALDSTQTSSISMALISDKGLVWAQALGTLGDAALTPVTPDTLYCIGSCSKLLATVSTLQLADHGLIQLDAPVARYIPAFSMLSPRYRDITVRMLLNHQSGFPGSTYSNGFTTLPFSGYSAQVLQTLATYRLKHQPGQMSVYCNDGFSVVEQLVLATTGMPYPYYVQRNILDPLGMANSRYATQLFPEGTFAPGYTPSGDPYQECLNVFASGGLFTTPSDMAQFARIFLNRGQVDGATLLSAQAVQAMGQLQVVNESLRPVPVQWGYGLGWDDVNQSTFATRGIRAWRKNGGTLVYGSEFYVLPHHGLAFMISGTSTSYPAEAIAEKVLYKALREQGIAAEPPEEITSADNLAASQWAASANEMSGIFANYQAVYKVSTLSESDALQVHKWASDHWEDHAIWRQRADGLFAGKDATLSGFGQAHAGAHRYLTLHTPSNSGLCMIDQAFAQSLIPETPLTAPWLARMRRTWIVINERFDSLALASGGPALTLFSLPELPGYVGVNAGPAATENQMLKVESADAAHMCLKIPYSAGRDLNDLTVESLEGHEHLRFGRSLFKPLDAFPVLDVNDSQRITINKQGHAQGFLVAKPMQLELQGALAAFVFDAKFEPAFPLQFRSSVNGVVPAVEVAGTTQRPAQLTLAEGGFILVYAAPGETISVSATENKTPIKPKTS